MIINKADFTEYLLKYFHTVSHMQYAFGLPFFQKLPLDPLLICPLSPSVNYVIFKISSDTWIDTQRKQKHYATDLSVKSIFVTIVTIFIPFYQIDRKSI